MENVQVFSLAGDGEARLSPHFRVREFACRDGADPGCWRRCGSISARR